MLYKPKTGYMWDTSVLYFEGKYYLFSMFRFPEQEDRHVWCAVSDNGVHFRDVGTVITDTHPVWKMFVHRCADRFIMNYGSLSGMPGHGNDTLRFYTSRDLLHWLPCEPQPCQHPDPRWYRQEERWDHMYTVAYGGKYHGFVVATAAPGLKRNGCGKMVSDDGVHWQVCPPVEILWGVRRPVNFEVGGCEQVGGRYYLIGGAFDYNGNEGYSVFTFEADSPLGPFRPAAAGYRLCGSSHCGVHRGVQWLASFGRGPDGEILLTNYMTAGHTATRNFIGTYENVWFTPIKKAAVDASGALRMAYWPKNDALKGRDITSPAEAAPLMLDASLRKAVRRVLTNLPDSGVFLEGSAQITSGACFGFDLVGDTLFRITMHPGASGTVRIWELSRTGETEPVLLDVIGEDTAGSTQISAGVPFFFQLLCRQDMFELYVDGYLVQTYLAPDHTAEVALFLENGQAKITGLKIYEMTL